MGCCCRSIRAQEATACASSAPSAPTSVRCRTRSLALFLFLAAAFSVPFALCRSDASHRSVFDVVPFPLAVPQIVKKAKVVKKEVEPIFSKADAMKLAPKTASEISALFFVLWSYYILCALLRAMIRFLSQAIALLFADDVFIISHWASLLSCCHLNP